MAVKIQQERQDTQEQDIQERQDTQEQDIQERQEINQLKIKKLLNIYEKKNNTFHIDKIKLKNSMNYELNCKIIQFYNPISAGYKYFISYYF